MKDPTAWVDDLTVFMDDEEIASTAEQLEPEVLYTGSKATAAVWLSVIALLGGAFGAVTLSPGIREGVLVFGGYLCVAAVLLRGFRPVTRRLFGEGLVWLASLTFFWATLTGMAAMLSAGFERTWLAYTMSVGLGFFLGMMHGSLSPNSVKREDEWMVAALLFGLVGTIAATWVSRNVLADVGAIPAAVIVGVIAAGLFLGPMSVLLMRTWDHAHGLAQMAKLYLHNDNFAPRAVAFLDRAIALKPDDAALYNLRGIAWSKVDEPAKAAMDWQRASELRPDDPEPLMSRGADHLRREEYDAAIETLRAALAMAPQEAAVHNNLGVALEQKGDLDGAMAHLDQAIELQPDHAGAYCNRAHTRFRRGDHRGAVADCDKVMSFGREHPKALVHRGDALSALGEREAAAESYETAISLGLRPDMHQQALRGLEALGREANSEAA